jgi:ABC-type transporter Mla subunit MlaD
MTPLLEPDDSSARGARRARASVVLTVVAVLAIGSYLAWKEGYFTPVEHFNFQTTSSKSLHNGMAVQLSGFKIGQVSRVELQSDRSVRVEMAVFRQYLGFLRADSEVRLEADLQLGGEPSLEITGGSPRALQAEPGATLRFRGQPQLYDQVVRVVGQLEPMVENITALLDQARQPQSELQVSLRNLAATTSRLQAWMPDFTARTDAMLDTFNRTGGLAANTLTPLARTDGDLQRTLRDLQATAAELRAALPPILGDLKTLSASLRSSAVGIEPSVKRLSSQIPALVEEGRRTTAGAGQVVDAVKDFSLIRRKIDQPPAEPVLPTSKP